MTTYQLYFILPFLCFSVMLSGQSTEDQDSLLLQIEAASLDKKIDLVKDFAQEYKSVAPKQVIALLKENLNHPQLTQLDSVDFYFLLSKAFYYEYNLKGHSEKIEAASSLLNNYTGPKTEYYHFLKYQEKALNAKHQYHGGYPKEALELYLDALNSAELSNNLTIKANLLREIGGFYIDQKEFTTALNYLNKCKEIGIAKTPKNEKFHIKLYAELSAAYLYTNELDSAQKYISLIPPQQYSLTNLFTIADFHQKKGNPQDAIVFLDAIIAKTKNGSLQHWLPFAQMKKGDNLYKLGKIAEAVTLWLGAESLFKEIDDKKNLLEIANRLYKHYREHGDTKKAFFYFEVASQLRDSAQLNNYSSALKGIESSHHLRLKEQENQTLKAKENINKDIIARQRIVGLLALLLIGALTALLFVYYKTSITRKRLNKELKLANDSLILKNKEVKEIADKLSFISDNFPEGVARLNNKFLITYSNEHFKSCFNVELEDATINIFQLFGFSENDLTKLVQDLSVNKTVSFNWICPYNKKVYQVQTVNIGFTKKQPEYLLVMEDVTELNQNAKLRLLESEQKFKNLESHYEKNSAEKNSLNQSLVLKKKELATKMMQISKRNADLDNILSDLRSIYASSNNTTKLKLTKVISKLNNVLNIEDGWETFNTYFQEVHPHFLDELRNKGDNLTNNEIRHCTYIKLGLANKEVANMLHVAPKSVEAARYRIKKKLNLSKKDSLSQYIVSIK